MHPFPHPHFALRRPPLPQFIGAGSSLTGLVPVVLPALAQPGDVLLWSPTLGSLNGGAGPALGSGMLLGRRLVAADFAPATFKTNGQVCWCVYRGIFALNFKASGSAVGEVHLAGFTKAPSCAGVLAAGFTQAPIGSAPTGKPPFVRRSYAHDSGAGAGCSIIDLLDPALYVDGTSVTFDGGGGFGSTTYGYLFEALF